MIPGNVDPRRPDKVTHYKPPQANGNQQPVEDLTPDYMNILGPDAATANADATESEESSGVIPRTTNGSSVIPTSPQYGVAIMKSDIAVPTTESTTISTDAVEIANVKISEDSATSKDMHSTPSRNDRFKVVKIASLEPFRRGRWKCMDYVDENPPNASAQSKSSQSSSNIQMTTGGAAVYMQTQSLPPQHFQQMLVQGNFAANPPPQFYQNVASQMIPPSQYFYAPQQLQPVQPAPYINTSQPYFAPNVGTGYTNYTNVQYMPSNLIQNQNTSAFVPTTQINQLPPNFQQSQTYAGPATNATPLVNGHAYPPPSTADAKNVILNTNIPPTIQPNIVSSTSLTQPPPQVTAPAFNYQTNSAPQTLTQIPSTVNVNVPVVSAQSVPIVTTLTQVPVNQPASTTTNVYTETSDVQHVGDTVAAAAAAAAAAVSAEPTAAEDAAAAGEDGARSGNPVASAIDNKIEQAMDLVKSHLMYTVREEVEVLKEKIAELMERIQQLETENSFLKQQIPKNQNLGTPDQQQPPQPAPPTQQQQQQQQQPQ